MLRFVMSRIASAVPTLLVVSISVFLLIRLIPGDPAALLLGDLATEASIAALRSKLGLDQGIIVQFLIWLHGILLGDFGISITTGERVLPLILARFWVSAQVVVIAVLLAVLLAVPAGLIAAWRQNGKLDLFLVGAATVLLSLPTFWLGLLMLMFFGLKLEWFPIIGYVSISENALKGAWYLVLPILTLTLHEVGVILRMARSSTLEVSQLDYITHARAKGLSEGAVLWRHAFKNSFGPTLTLIGIVLGNLLGGIAVVETVFTIPGLGRLMVEAIYARDYPVIQGCLLFTAAIYVLINLVVDLLYPVFDPKVAAS
jgi:peptide/nickel transport system permease protein